jgi:hypothetical protein
VGVSRILGGHFCEVGGRTILERGCSPFCEDQKLHLITPRSQPIIIERTLSSDQGLLFSEACRGGFRRSKGFPFERYILAIHSHSAVEQQGLSVDRYG